MELIGEANRDAILRKGPKLLDQPVIQFARPLARQKRDDLVAAIDEFRAIAPSAVRRIGERDAGGIAAVPGVFARRTFCAALSCVKGGSGGRFSFDMMGSGALFQFGSAFLGSPGLPFCAPARFSAPSAASSPCAARRAPRFSAPRPRVRSAARQARFSF